MNLTGEQLKDTYGNLVTIGSVAGSPTTGTLQNGAGNNLTSVTIGGDITIADKIIHSGDTNTAIRFPANDTVSIETDGAEAIRIDSTRRFLVGTTTDPTISNNGGVSIAPANNNRAILRLATTGSGELNLLDLINSNGIVGQLKTSSSDVLIDADSNLILETGSTERMRIDSSGNVGIGNTMSSSYSGESTGNGGELSLGNDSGDFESVLKLIGYSNTSDSVVSTIDFLDRRNFDCIAKIISSRDTTTFGKGNIRFETASASGTLNEAMRIDSDGNVLVGTTTDVPNFTPRLRFVSVADSGDIAGSFVNDTATVQTLSVLNQDTSGTRTLVDFRTGSGNGTSNGQITSDGTNVSYGTTSDYRLKENVVPMVGALDKVAQLKPSRFNFISDADKTVDGFLAHEVQEIIPNAVNGEKDAVDEEGNPIYQGIDHSKLVPILVGAIQELKAEIEQLKNQ